MSKEINILILSTEFPPGPGGIGHHCFSLASALNNLDICITVLTQGDYVPDELIAEFDSWQRFKIVRYRRYKNSLITYLRRFFLTISILRSNNFSHIFLTGKFALWQGLIIKMFNPNLKSVAIIHGTEVNLSNILLRKFTHKAIGNSDNIVAVSNFTKSLLPDKVKNEHSRLFVIPNGIDNSWVEPKNKDNLVLKGNPVLLTVGHVSLRKGQHRVIKSLNALRYKYPELHYHIVGNPIIKDQLVELADNLGVLDFITFHNTIPSHDDLTSFYNAADIFMLLSENQPNGDVEGFGIVALEANIHGVPVVGAKYCGVEDAVKHQFSGYLVNGDYTDDIVAGVSYCLDNKDKLAISSKEWAKQHNWNQIVYKYLEILK